MFDSDKQKHALVSAAFALGCWAAMGAGAAWAQAPADESTTTEETEASDSTAGASAPKFSFHAYINQAYAKSQDHQIFGIPEDGTTNYRDIAVQFRYEINKKNLLVTQLSHDRFGNSTLNQAHSEVQIDSAFYQRSLTDATSLRVGKMRMPRGIYNETRHVGSLIPFYRPPSSLYLDNNTTENLEGVMVFHSFARGADWSVDGDFFYGGWDRIEQSNSSGNYKVARAEDGFGTQLWLNTPFPGVRFGLSGIRFHLTNRLSQVGKEDLSKTYLVSFDGDFDRFYTRAEYLWTQLPLRVSPSRTGKLEYRGYYGQAGVRFASKWTANLQYEIAEIDLNLGSGYGDFNKDRAAGLNYNVDANVVAKVELHRSDSRLVDKVAVTAPVKSKYGIVSLAISF
ncbi:MAG TPA: hypothetical protein VGX68_24500 [Thermoanaerobaculia bacterium]|jgi:hypothetical protein|nr:hypothetical protein [Thermoanaerobaculia bacterium]